MVFKTNCTINYSSFCLLWDYPMVELNVNDFNYFVQRKQQGIEYKYSFISSYNVLF